VEIESRAKSSEGVPEMLNRFLVWTAGLLSATLLFPVSPFAQTSSTRTWPEPIGNREQVAEKDKKPAPRRSLAGLWGSRDGNQSKGVQLHPNDGTQANMPPYTPYGLQLFKSHKPLEAFDAVAPAFNNDPRTLCEPLGFPRANHYDLGVRIYQDETNVAILYQYDNRWRIIWTDGRPLPKLLDGGVEIDNDYRDQRWMGYSVGKWIDDYTLEVHTVGTMPEDRAWLDNAGRPISDQVHVTETFRRLDNDTLEWSETLEDPKVFTKPWETMKLRMTLQDPRIDILTRYCSPKEIEIYNQTYGDFASGK
jgi:hypothetical protein